MRLSILSEIASFFANLRRIRANLIEKAGDGNRTRVCSLGSCHSTIELHPRSEADSPLSIL